MTRLFLIGAALFASACSFHTHDTVIVQPAQPRPVYAAAPRERVEPSERRPVRARPEKPRPGGVVTRPSRPPGDVAERPNPRPAGTVGERPKPRPRPYVDRRKSPKRVVVCTREAQKHRKECLQKASKG